QILGGAFDETYEASVNKIGEVHNKLGLEPRWYIGGYNALASDLLEEIALKMPVGRFETQTRAKRASLQKAILRAAMLDMDIAISVYIEAGRRDRIHTLNTIATNFEGAIGGVVSIVASAATELQASAQSLQ
ncbi:protoglobin domain-containing protein, partial [Acinetobacter baumannii]|uniref:protoglobin domain-containing protein n=1 Tax=Acinetobacter baumannii TaxID=470 RepID=UPI000B049F88